MSRESLLVRFREGVASTLSYHKEALAFRKMSPEDKANYTLRRIHGSANLDQGTQPRFVADFVRQLETDEDLRDKAGAAGSGVLYTRDAEYF